MALDHPFTRSPVHPFTPRGILAALAALLVAGTCIALGFWQLSRLEQRRERNARVEAAMGVPVVELSSALLDSIQRDPEPFLYRHVQASGRFDTAGVFLLRGRAHQGSPGVRLVSELVLEGGAGTILADRGWLPSPDAATADPRPYLRPVPVKVKGILQPLRPASASDRPLEIDVDGYPVRTARTLAGGARPDLAHSPVYLQLLPDSAAPDALPRPEPLPALDEGPHLGYAVQWFSFAAIALIGFSIVAFRRRTPR